MKKKPKSSRYYKYKFFMYALLFSLIIAPARTIYTELETHAASKSIVELLAPDNSGGGTGFEISYKGKQYTMTNGHVCGLGKSQGYMVLVSPHARIRKVRILEESQYSDLCLLEPALILPPLELGSQELEVGKAITVLGHPLLGPLHASRGSVQSRVRYIDVMISLIESKTDRLACNLPKNRIKQEFFGLVEMCVIEVESQHTDAYIQPGNSGSPVLDWAGRVSGVAFAANSDDGEAEIIPWSSVEFFLNHHIPYFQQNAPEHH